MEAMLQQDHKNLRLQLTRGKYHELKTRALNFLRKLNASKGNFNVVSTLFRLSLSLKSNEGSACLLFYSENFLGLTKKTPDKFLLWREKKNQSDYWWNIYIPMRNCYKNKRSPQIGSDALFSNLLFTLCINKLNRNSDRWNYFIWNNFRLFTAKKSFTSTPVVGENLFRRPTNWVRKLRLTNVEN